MRKTPPATSRCKVSAEGLLSYSLKCNGHSAKFLASIKLVSMIFMAGLPEDFGSKHTTIALAVFNFSELVKLQSRWIHCVVESSSSFGSRK